MINSNRSNALNYIISKSPLKDANGNKFILLSKHFIRCFYNSYTNESFNEVSDSTTAQEVHLIITDARYEKYDIHMNFDEPDPLMDDLKRKICEIYNPFKGKGHPPTYYILRRSDIHHFDLYSAISNLMAYMDKYPDDKYLYPLRVDKTFIRDTHFGGFVKVFDFLNNFKEDLLYINGDRTKENYNDKHKQRDQIVDLVKSESTTEKDVKFTNQTKITSAKKSTSSTNKIIKDVEKFERKAEKYYDEMIKAEERGKNSITPKELLDKVMNMVDNLDSITLGHDLIKLADHIFEEVDKKGLKVSVLSKYYKKPTMMIRDDCGYPVVNDIDDIPSPFPEEIEGDEKLANL